MITAEQKLTALKEILLDYRSTLIAYSGGVDSVFLAKVAHDTLGEKSLAVIADSPSLPRREFEEALALGKQFGFPVRVVQTNEMEDPNYTANPANRCYFCKHELFDSLAPIARAEHFAVLCYGENASDIGDHRPGAQAATEFSVKAPLKVVGLTKTEIRELSRALGLPTAEKPQMACLSSRLPYGEEVTTEKLAMIEAAENVLRDAGFHDVRVRHHSSKNGSLARLEVGSNEIPRLLSEDLREQIAVALRKIGYAQVTVDLLGYRRGSLNQKREVRSQNSE